MSQYCVLCHAWGTCLFVPLKVNFYGVIWSWLPSCSISSICLSRQYHCSHWWASLSAPVNLHADLCSWRWRATFVPAWEGEWEGMCSLTFATLVTRCFSSLSATLTANKGILHIWQNISRVTFRSSVYVLWKIKGWAHLPESFAAQRWSHWIFCS